MSVFKDISDDELMALRILPVRDQQDFEKFRSREELGLYGITWPIPFELDVETVAGLYKSVKTHPELRTKHWGKSGYVHSVNFDENEKEMEDMATSLPKKLNAISDLLKTSFHLAISGRERQHNHASTFSIRADSLFPCYRNHFHQNFVAVANVDGSSTIIYNPEKTGPEKIELPPQSISVFLGSLEHQAPEINKYEENQRLNMLYLSPYYASSSYDLVGRRPLYKL